MDCSNDPSVYHCRLLWNSPGLTGVIITKFRRACLQCQTLRRLGSFEPAFIATRLQTITLSMGALLESPGYISVHSPRFLTHAEQIT